MPSSKIKKQNLKIQDSDNVWKRNFPLNIRPEIRLQAIGIIFAVFLFSSMSVIALNTARIPYFAIFPGSVRDVGTAISISDADPSDSDVYPIYRDDTQGAFGFVTARVTDALSPLRWVRHSLDGESEIFHVKVLGEDQRRPEARRQAGQIEIRNSQNTATLLAFQILGIEVPETPAGLRVIDILDCANANNVLQERDIILGVDDREILTNEALGEELMQKKPGESVSLNIDRNGQILTGLNVVLGSRNDSCFFSLFNPEPEPGDDTGNETSNENPEDSDRSAIGLTIAQIIDRHPPVNVGFDTGNVGGSSAGLAFTLGVIDLLSPGDLTGGLKVASTGSISIDGTVNPIGGAKEKLISVKRQDFDIFLVPASQVAEVQNQADDVEIIGVENIQDALEALYSRGADRLPKLDG